MEKKELEALKERYEKHGVLLTEKVMMRDLVLIGIEIALGLVEIETRIKSST